MRFRESGDAFATAYAAGLGGLGQAAEDMAHELGRSIPGFHAGEMIRVHKFLNQRPDIGSLDALITQDHLDVAAMHALMAVPSDTVPRLAMISPAASFAAAARSRLYDPTIYYSWIFGVLKEYDLADCIAACVSLGTRVTVLGPLDEASQPMNTTQANIAYAFPGFLLDLAVHTFHYLLAIEVNHPGWAQWWRGSQINKWPMNERIADVNTAITHVSMSLLERLH